MISTWAARLIFETSKTDLRGVKLDHKVLKLSFIDKEGNSISHIIPNIYDFFSLLHEKKLHEGWN